MQIKYIHASAVDERTFPLPSSPHVKRTYAHRSSRPISTTDYGLRIIGTYVTTRGHAISGLPRVAGGAPTIFRGYTPRSPSSTSSSSTLSLLRTIRARPVPFPCPSSLLASLETPVSIEGRFNPAESTRDRCTKAGGLNFLFLLLFLYLLFLLQFASRRVCFRRF